MFENTTSISNVDHCLAKYDYSLRCGGTLPTATRVDARYPPSPKFTSSVDLVNFQFCGLFSIYATGGLFNVFPESIQLVRVSF